MTIKLPEMLSFDRKLEISDALMYAGKWGGGDTPEIDQDWKKIAITKRQNRSTISAYGTKDEDKTKPNPVSSDSDDANLPHDKDTLKVSFTLRAIGNIGKPFGCNKPDFETAVTTKISQFKEQGLRELAHRYAHNIAAGRFLWRNRLSADMVMVYTKVNDSEGYSFNASEIPLNNFGATSGNEDIKQLAEAVYRGLSSEDDFVCISVDAYVRLGNGQHVFPSQEMNIGKKEKVLFKLDGCAAMHSVKIGNAIRTIDDWYTGAEFPIAVEPFGSVTQMGQAYRKSKIDLYTLMLEWVNDKDIGDDQRYFVLANLVRGGVFGGKGE